MNAGPRLRVLHAGAECYPQVKTGGLGDVLAALPAAQCALGLDARLLLPAYPAFRQVLQGARRVARLGPAFGAARIELLMGQLPGQLAPAYLIDAPWFYDRPGNPYLRPDGGEWPDNLARYALLGWVAAQLAEGGLDPDWAPQLVHAHDWHAALAPVYLAAHGTAGTGARRARSVLTIHNLAYQGRAELSAFALLGLPHWMAGPAGIEFHGELRLLKGGLMLADRITTVSPGYAAEILTPAQGHQLDPVLRHRAQHLSGILNGIDESIWDPASDPGIEARYRAHDLTGKAACKAALQRECGLPEQADAPLMTVVSRLSHQKGLDLLLAALPRWLDGGGQVALLGSGEPALEAAWLQAASAHPRQVAVRIGYDEAMAHRLMAGADLIAVPSRFEPCGLTQLYGMRYGTLPLVHRVGGLGDTVSDVDAPGSEPATGFVFEGADAQACGAALRRVLRHWSDRSRWQQLMRQAMSRDHSWRVPAQRFEALYRDLIGGGEHPALR